jgi:hypothetical protein
LKTLIVIASHGNDFTPKLVRSIPSEHDILVVETGDGVSDGYPVENRIRGGFCVAAYEHAYRKNRAKYDSFLFLHDSMLVKDRDFLEVFQSRGDVVAWIGFRMDMDSATREYLKSFYGACDAPTGIFGPIFYATRHAMDTMTEKHLSPPHPRNRFELAAAERAYGIAFHRSGFVVKYLEEYDNERLDVTRDYVYFDKYRPNRP